MSASKKRSCLQRPMPQCKKLKIFSYIQETFINLCEKQYRNNLKNIKCLWRLNRSQLLDCSHSSQEVPVWLDVDELQTSSSVIISLTPLTQNLPYIKRIATETKLIGHVYPIPNSDGLVHLENNTRSENEIFLNNAPYIEEVAELPWHIGKKLYKDIDEVYDDIPIMRNKLWEIPAEKLICFVKKIWDQYTKHDEANSGNTGILTSPSAMCQPPRYVFSLISKVFPHMGSPSNFKARYLALTTQATLQISKSGLEMLKLMFCQRCCIYNCMVHESTEEESNRFAALNTDFEKTQYPCGLSCYTTEIKRAKKLQQEVIWTDEEQLEVKQLLQIFPNKFCEVGIMLGTSKSCQDVYKYVKDHEVVMPQFTSSRKLRNSDESDILSPQKDQRKLYNGWANRQLQLNKTTEKGLRKIVNYTPCNHPGRHCIKTDNCPCIQNGTSCEKFCNCSLNCVNRFPGCRCKNCTKSKSCACAIAMRECDPDICVSCGASKMDAPEVSCQNMPIQLKKGVDVQMGRSKVHGWGVFTPVDIKKNAFIGEYCGEIISRDEAERRGAIYHMREKSYLFKLNEELEVDASRMGNVMRFVNHSKRPNCFTEVMLVNGDHRIGLFAKHNIAARDELFFDYGKEFVEVLPLKG